MRVPKVRPYIRVCCPDGQYAHHPPAYNKNRMIQAGYATIDGQSQAHPEGVYDLRYLRGKKRVWRVAAHWR